MTDLNRVVLIGRLTRDAELKYTANGQAVCNFSIAVNRSKKNGDQWEDEANFFDIVVWGRMGEACAQYLVKGKMVGIDGELRQDKWQQDGQNRSKVVVIASNLQLLGGGGASGGSGSGGGYSGKGGGAQGAYPPGGGSASPEKQPWQGGGGQGSSAPADDGFADDIPF